MKNTRKRATAIALSALMAVSTIGAATVSAAEVPTEDNTTTMYFVNNKDWKDVYGYVWNSETGTKEAQFPGEELECVGTTTEGGFKDEQSVYELTFDADEYDSMIFSEGTEHGQQSKDYNIHGSQQRAFYLGDDNEPVLINDFNATCITPLKRTLSTNNITCLKAGENGNKMFINTNGVTEKAPEVMLTSLNGSTTQVKVEAEKANGKTITGKYVAEVPQGYYIRATVKVDGKECSTDITDTTDSIKLTSTDGKVSAEACQRIYFNNTLSTKKMANQEVKVYAWNIVSSKEETSFANASKMTYYNNNVYGDNVYFYDVPLSYDHVIFLSSNCKTGECTAQTQNVQLNVTTNTPDSVVMDGYYVSNTSVNPQSVSLYDTQVIA